MAHRLRALQWGVLALVFAAGAAPASADTPEPPRVDPPQRDPPRGEAASNEALAGEGSAPAQPANPQERFEAAQKLFDEGKHADALDVFREVYRATMSPNARLMIGHCLVALGRTAEAYDELSAAMREASKRADAEPKYARTRDAAATEVARLEQKVGRLIIALADPAATDVALNGVRLSSDRIGVPIAINPGAVVVTASKSGGGSVRLEAALRGGEIKTVTVVFKDEARAVVAPSDRSLPAGGEGGFARRGGVRTIGFVTAGIGVAGMVMFGVAGSMVQSKLSTLEDECGSARCRDPKYASVIDSGKILTTVTNIGLITGVVGILGGGAMIALGGRSSAAPAKTDARISLGVSPSGAGFVATGAF